MVPLIGYIDRLSARPGEQIAVKVSSQSDQPYRGRSGAHQSRRRQFGGTGHQARRDPGRFRRHLRLPFPAHPFRLLRRGYAC